jgi:hypothetical protein
MMKRIPDEDKRDEDPTHEDKRPKHDPQDFDNEDEDEQKEDEQNDKDKEPPAPRHKHKWLSVVERRHPRIGSSYQVTSLPTLTKKEAPKEPSKSE